MSQFSDERAYLRGTCRDGEEFRSSAAVSVAALQRMQEHGEEVPVSGDATLRWIGGYE